MIGSSIASDLGDFAEGATIYIDAGVKDGYTFTGWSSDDAITLNDPTSLKTFFTMIANAVTVTATWLATHATRLEICAEAVTKNIEAFTDWSWKSTVDDLSAIVNNTITAVDTEVSYEFDSNTVVVPSTNKVPGSITYTATLKLDPDTKTITGVINLPVVPQNEWEFNCSVVDSRATVTGAGKYKGEETVTIDAGSLIGHSFAGWTVNTGEDVTLDNVNDAVTTFVMPFEDVSLSASFAQINYTVTMDEHCDTAKGIDETYNYGETVEITCVNDRFVEWSCDDPTVVFADKTNAITTFTMPAKNITVDHTFSTYDVTVTDGGEGVTGAGAYAPGATVTVVAGTKGGYEFVDFTSDVTIDGITKPNATTVTFTMPQNSVAMTGTWLGLLKIADGVVSATDALKAKPDGSVDLTIPTSIDGVTVTTIVQQAFESCTSLASITIPNSVTSIGEYAFMGCILLTSITIPNSVTEIGIGTFQGCTALSSINIPNSVTSIGYRAFQGCTALTSINIPESVTYIDDNAFQECTALTSITIPDSVTTIGYGAFIDCDNLTALNIHKTSGSITGAPWGAPVANAVKWAKYNVTMAGVGVGSTGNGPYAPGTTVTINAGTFTPPAYFAGWTNVPAGADANAVQTTFVMPESDVAITGVNTVNKYNVTVTGSNLPNDQNGSGLYATGTTVTVKAGEPAAGMKFVGWECSTNNVTPL